MNRILIAVLAVVASLYVCEAGMKCGIAGECPGINKIGEAFTGVASGKDYCCKTNDVVIPYCCNAADYAKHRWSPLTEGTNANHGSEDDNRSTGPLPSEMGGSGAAITGNSMRNGVHPLTKEQLLQAMEWLLRNDRDFMRKIHEAYVTSLLENRRSR